MALEARRRNEEETQGVRREGHHLDRGKKDFKEVEGGERGERGRELGQKPGECIIKEASERKCLGKEEMVTEKSRAAERLRPRRREISDQEGGATARLLISLGRAYGVVVGEGAGNQMRKRPIRGENTETGKVEALSREVGERKANCT